MRSIFVWILFLLLPLSVVATPPRGEALRYLPIQDGGRVKPFDVFAREKLELVYGKQTFEGRQAYEIILTWMLSPEAWREKAIFEVRNYKILQSLALDSSRRYFKGDEIFSSPQLQPLMMELQNKREAKEKLTPYFQDLQRLENQFFVFREIASGRLLRLVPDTNPEVSSWRSVPDFDEKFQQSFIKVTQAFIETLTFATREVSRDEMREGFDRLDESVRQFEAQAKEVKPSAFPSDMKISAEVHLVDFHPFRVAYIFYIFATLSLLMLWVFGAKPGAVSFFVKASWVLASCGLVLHTYGFLLRTYITDRPPVATMYETVVWVSWGALIFAFILEWIYKFRFILFAGLLGGILCLVLADNAPAVLDPSLQPLEAVLRSNYWLIVHVMTITISYAAFLLAFILGDVGLFYYLRGADNYKKEIRDIVTGIYRSIQIGVAFLAPGIILGGIWADASWGRFWGWDPKEVWALIALLGYLAIFHGRLAGIIKDFGMVASGVVSFSLVIMAWYGVNYVLGAGLHSYGFGAGGVEYVTGFVVAHFIYVAIVSWKHFGKTA